MMEEPVSIVNARFAQEVPSTLFHYTSIESLALILTNKTLRLNPLSKLDDLQEMMTEDAPNIGNYTFVSCWTDVKEESIPMWNMYAGLDCGVRIEMEIDPFKRYTYTEKKSSEVVGRRLESESPERVHEFFLPIEDIRKGAFSPALLQGKGILHRIEYTTDQNHLQPKTQSGDESHIEADFSNVGTYKNVYWGFQKEWRYILRFMPMDVFGDLSTALQRFAIAGSEMLNGSLPPLFDHYDLHLRDDAIEGMKFVLSPKITFGNRVLIENLLSDLGLSSNVESSELSGLL